MFGLGLEVALAPGVRQVDACLGVELAQGSGFVANQRLLLPAPQGPTVVTQCLERPWALKPALLRPFLSRRLLVGHLILGSLISTLSLKVEIKEIYSTE